MLFSLFGLVSQWNAPKVPHDWRLVDQVPVRTNMKVYSYTGPDGTLEVTTFDHVKDGREMMATPERIAREFPERIKKIDTRGGSGYLWWIVPRKNSKVQPAMYVFSYITRKDFHVPYHYKLNKIITIQALAAIEKAVRENRLPN